MANMSSKARRPVDAASKITLRPEASVALVAAATVNEAAVSLDALTSYWDSGIVPMQHLEAVFHVNAATFTSNETYALALEVADDSGFTTNVVEILRTPNIAGKTGMYVLPLDVPTVKKFAPGAKFIRAKSVTVGIAPSLDFYAWLL